VNDGRDAFALLEYAILGAVALAVVLYKMLRKSSANKMQDGPVLSSDEMLGRGNLQSMARGSLAGFSYNLLTNETGRVMLLVQLGHNSFSHIIAYGDKSRLSQATKAELDNRWVEPAVLEGDFPDYFHMFCNPELQVGLRQVFTPDVMADFCRSYDFEMFEESLYFSKAEDATDRDDSTSLVSDVTRFLTKNGELLKHLTP
jgi:hypothetical protein